MALDVYCWLAYRLHVLNKPKTVSWQALRIQFSPNVKHLFHFRAHFKDNLALALAVYPAARVEESENGLTLFPSPPPVSPKVTAPDQRRLRRTQASPLEEARPPTGRESEETHRLPSRR